MTEAADSAARLQPSQSNLVSMFRVAGVLCAVPLAATVEVIPRPPRLAPTPFGKGTIAGTVQLRGNVIPVIDLAATFAADASCKASIIMVISEQDRLLGILVDELCGLHPASEQDRVPLHFKAPQAARPLFTSTFQSGEDIAYLLDSEAVCSLSDVPTVARQRDRAVNTNLQNGKPILFFRAGQLMLAVEAVEIEATVPVTQVAEGPLSSRVCLGTMVHLDQVLPVADLGVVLGFETSRKARNKTAAIVLRFPTGGRVALAVDDVHDIGATGSVKADGIPGIGPLDCKLFSGIVSDKQGRQHMLLKAQGLLESSDLMTLSRVSHPLVKAARAQSGSAGSAAAEAEGEARDFLFFRAGRKFAAPLKQIIQIIHFPQEAIGFPELPGGLQGLTCHRAKSVPIVDLASSLGIRASHPEDKRYVLVVEVGSGLFGLVVHHLYTVEKSRLLTTKASAPGGINRNPHLPPTRMVRMSLDGKGELVEYIDLLETVSGLAPPGQQPVSQSLALTG